VKVCYEIDRLRLRLGEAEILRGVSVAFAEGQMTAIVGPNGAGKSTLMSVLSAFRTHYEGRCLFRGREVREWNRRELAREMAFIPQSVRIEFPFTAEQVVFMGRTPHCRGLFESREDRAAVERALATTDVLGFAGRDFRALSGGERQRVLLASALAQQPAVLLLDEPTTFLDLQHQVRTYELLRDLCGRGITVVAVTHDLNLAASYADRIVVLAEGRVAADAAPEAVLRPALLREVFGVHAEVRVGPAGRPWVIYGQGASPDGTPRC
jgi:iron complex transport system ATP-binding protein